MAIIRAGQRNLRGRAAARRPAAAAVVPGRHVLDDRQDLRRVAAAAEDLQAHRPRPRHHRRFVGVQRPGLQQDVVGHADHADVVQQGGDLDLLRGPAAPSPASPPRPSRSAPPAARARPSAHACTAARRTGWRRSPAAAGPTGRRPTLRPQPRRPRGRLASGRPRPAGLPPAGALHRHLQLAQQGAQLGHPMLGRPATTFGGARCPGQRGGLRQCRRQERLSRSGQHEVGTGLGSWKWGSGVVQAIATDGYPRRTARAGTQGSGTTGAAGPPAGASGCPTY